MRITGDQVADPYVPDRLVGRGRPILRRPCERTEAEQPSAPAGPVRAHPGGDGEFDLLEVE